MWCHLYKINIANRALGMVRSQTFYFGLHVFSVLYEIVGSISKPAYLIPQPVRSDPKGVDHWYRFDITACVNRQCDGSSNQALEWRSHSSSTMHELMLAYFLNFIWHPYMIRLGYVIWGNKVDLKLI